MPGSRSRPAAELEPPSKGMKLDPEKRYLLARPRGGFNDAMVQFGRARLYAAKYNRVLVVDMSRSGFRGPITDTFRIPEGFGCELVDWNDDVASAFDAATSVKPDVLRHNISKYKTRWRKRRRGSAFFSKGRQVSFDHSKDHAEQVLVSEQAGGGRASLDVLQAMSLTAEMANTVARRVRKLGRGYDAVHIRHSDYKTDFKAFLTRLRPVLQGRRVLICSDSHAAKQAAESILDPSTTVLSVSDIPDLGGAPLHAKDVTDYEAANVDMLCDLFAMALADNLMFTTLSGAHQSRSKVAGFSLLADSLRRHPEWVRNLLSLADTEVFDDLFPSGPVAIDRPDLRRRLRLLDLWRWNYRAKRVAAVRAREAAGRPLRPEEIPPRFLG